VGRRRETYLDWPRGIVTVSVGHCNEEVNGKIHAQLDRLQHVSTVFANQPQAELARDLAAITPGGKLTSRSSPTAGPRRTRRLFWPRVVSRE
jgi:adenosylmethionine-8-amino-7-oxononanoate aminotransferase